MTSQLFQATIEEIYGDTGLSEAAIEGALTRSLNPRPATMLYDKIGALGLGPHHLLLDVGSRDARHTCELVRRYGCRAVGVEPSHHNLRLAEEVIAAAGLGDQVQSLEGRIEALPVESEQVDYLWCRDVLNHAPDLAGGLAECVRVLKPGGRMLVYQTFATPLLEPGEAARLYAALAIVAANMNPAYFEQQATSAGLTLLEVDIVASEWREWWEENGPQTTSKQLLTIARLRRDRKRLLAELGQVNYEVELANCHWGVYQLLGKLEPRVYSLEKGERKAGATLHPPHSQPRQQPPPA
jgi:SAM-dependent methyltransferase